MPKHFGRKPYGRTLLQAQWLQACKLLILSTGLPAYSNQPLAYSDTFLVSLHCQCKREGLYKYVCIAIFVAIIVVLGFLQSRAPQHCFTHAIPVGEISRPTRLLPHILNCYFTLTADKL